MGMSEFQVRKLGRRGFRNVFVLNTEFGRVVWFLNNSAQLLSQVIVNVLRFDQEKFGKIREVVNE